MNSNFKITVVLILLLIGTASIISSYPIDGYLFSQIRRLNRLQLILEGKINDTKLLPGQLLSINDIKLSLYGTRLDSLTNFRKIDAELQNKLNRLFPNKDESYSICVLEITAKQKLRYAERQPDRTFMPGSIGKLAVIAGLFAELEKIYPASFTKRIELLKKSKVKAGRWAIPNSHTIPIFDPETKAFEKRLVRERDVCTLFEWADHMLSVSSNAAASVVWKELVLLRHYGINYPPSEEEEKNFFEKTPKTELRDMMMSVVNDPLRKIGITETQWQLGSFFTKEGKRIIPGEGGSIASPFGLMKYLVALEKGEIVDKESSLEIKRLMYMTDRRIRYAQSPALKNAAVYFKSGSYYSCIPEPDFECKKYSGNKQNYMNSVAIIEHPDGTKYFVTLMSNVLKKNSGTDHMYLASEIDRIIRQR